MRVTPPLHEALRQVRELQQAILDKQRFKGYSGRARALGGCVALAAGLILRTSWVSPTPAAHLLGWTIVFLLALVTNYAALIYWFWHDPHVERDVRHLRPALDMAPILLVGGMLTFALVHHGQFNLLFGVWMMFYSLMNLTSRSVLPRALTWVGAYYLAAGAICLFAWPGLSFTKNSLVMGLVFFVGEFLGGIVLHNDLSAVPSLRTFFGLTAAHRDKQA